MPIIKGIKISDESIRRIKKLNPGLKLFKVGSIVRIKHKKIVTKILDVRKIFEEDYYETSYGYFRENELEQL